LTCGSVLILSAVFLFQGCGLKADPSPRQFKPLKPLTDLKLWKNAGGIFIQWRVQEQDNRMTRFRVMRSEFGTDGESCPGCPPDEIKIADLAAGEARLVKVDANVFGYQDTTAKPGNTYRYRVTGCSGSGICSEASMPARLSLTDDTVSGGGVDVDPVRKEPSIK